MYSRQMTQIWSIQMAENLQEIFADIWYSKQFGKGDDGIGSYFVIPPSS